MDQVTGRIRYSTRRHPGLGVLAFFCALIMGGSPVVHAEQDSSATIMQSIADSAVFIRAERVFRNQTFPTSGTGFFVHPDGYLVTNWHVIADQIEGTIFHKDREVNAKVIKLSVVIESGTPKEREIPVKIVARDRKRDLALLKVDYRPKTYISFTPIDDVTLGENVWIAGFPFGDLLASERKIDDLHAANPEVTISKGMVTSLRRDSDGELARIQTDAPLNPGCSGAAMVNSKGHLVGVVFAGVSGGQGIGFGIAPNRVRDFFRRQSVKTSFRPRTVLSPPQPIKVTVSPILLPLDFNRGEVRFDGSDIEAFTVELEEQEGVLSGIIEFPDRKPDIEQPEYYYATITLFSAAAGEPIKRRYRLQAVPQSFSTLHSQRDPAKMMEDRYILKNETKISDFAKTQQVSVRDKDRKSLADRAGTTVLGKNEKGSVVLDNNTLKDVAEEPIDPKRYRYIQDTKIAAMLRRYDRVQKDLQILKREFMEHGGDLTYEQWLASQNQVETAEKLSDDYRSIGNDLVFEGVLFCPEKQVYFMENGKGHGCSCAGISIRSQ